MAYEVVMPRLGWNMETGRLVEWLKQDGERVEAGELLLAIEADKAIQEVEALESGILYIPAESPPAGEEVPVGTLLGYLLAEGEEAPSGAAAGPMTGSEPASASAPAQVVEATGHPLVAAVQQTGSAAGKPSISPRAKRVAQELGVDWTGLAGSGRTGRIVEKDVRSAAAALAAAPAARISPLARRLADELGVDVDRLAAEIPDRRIMRSDVEAAAREMTVVPAVAPSITQIPFTQTRRLIAERMAGSARTTAAVTLTSEADATELLRLRRQLKDDARQQVPTYGDLLAKLVAQALLEHPGVNARLDGETIVQTATVNIGIAVDTDRGLLVPVLRDAQDKSLHTIIQESAVLIEKARTGRVSTDDLRGGTFTITNLGMYDIDGFTPIINLPECAILGVGRIVPKQVVVAAVAERVAIRHMMFLSLTFDHRVVDGAPAARFLQRVKQYVEQPYLWLVRDQGVA